jgi:hypothetical protein
MTVHHDAVTAPSHYRGTSGLQSIDVTEAWRLGPHLTQAVDYLLRAGRKSADPRQDLLKAAWYVRRASARPLPDLRFAVAANLPPHFHPVVVAADFRLEPARAAVLLAIYRAVASADDVPVATTLETAANVLAALAAVPPPQPPPAAQQPPPFWAMTHRESA